MDIPYIDKRSERDLIEYIKKLSSSYTPEWEFDETNADIGTALALIYSNMHYGTIKRFNKTAQKSMFDFFNSINTEMLSASAAEGYASFGLSGDNLREGVEVKSGTQISASRKGKEILFKTLDDVLVNNADIRYAYLTNGDNDVIMKLYEYSDEIKECKIKNLELFNVTAGENVQQHILEIYHRNVFDISGSAYAGIKFVRTDSDNDDISEELENAVNSDKLHVQYYSKGGYVDFGKISVMQNGITAYKTSSQPFFKKNDDEFSIRIISESENLFSDRVFKRIECFSQSKNIIPDAVFTDDIEKNVNQFYPFNEKPFQYDEFYIASKDAFCKKGADINVSFYIDFDRIPVENENAQEVQIEYKLIMKHSQFKPEEKFDLTIDSVIWEYFNGRGWARLFRDNRYEDIFHPKNGRRTKTISFICPDDIEPLTVNSKECYYIRAKVLKVNNQFKTKGTFITPVLSEINIEYSYGQNIIPDKIICRNNTADEIFYTNDFNSSDSAIEPFRYLSNPYSELYLGFNNPPEYGPVKYLFCMKENVDFETFKLKWSYMSKDGWKTLSVFDETESFRKTGLITMMGNTDFEESVLFGRKAYWIKISDFQNEYADKKNNFYPVLEEIHKNTVNIINVEDMPEEIFSLDAFEENKICRLTHDMIYQLEVWIDEISELTENEKQELESEDKLDIVYDVYGIPVNMWVRWTETDDLGFSSPSDRHFKADKNEGIVIFGDNIHGKIPAYKNGDTIKIKYSVGGGRKGNLKKYAISKINQTLGFVTNVYNPLITYGGYDIETAESAINRTSSKLRNCSRAVTAFDYESLVMEAERNVLKVKCISNMRPDGTKSFGNILIVILTENYNEEKSYFISVKEKVEKYISSKMSGNLYNSGGLYVIQPQCIYYNIKAEVSVKSFRSVFEVKSEIEKRINEFLDMSTGNFDNKGWDIGILPNTTQILNAIKNIKGISFIKNIVLTPYVNINSVMCETDINNLKGKEFSLAFSGKHDIIITVD